MVRGALPAILTFLLFGIVVPWFQGLDLLDPVAILTYAALSIVFVAPLAANSPTKLAFPILFSWGLFLLTLLQALATVNYLKWMGHILTPSMGVLASAALLALSGSTAFAFGSALVSIRSTAKLAHSSMRVALLVVLLLMAWTSKTGHLPPTDAGLIRLALLLSAGFGILTLLFWRLRLRRSPSPSQGPLYGLEKD